MKLDRLSSMSKKTKAEKIAAALRAKKQLLRNSASESKIATAPMLQNSSVVSSSPRQDADVYNPKDLRKTIVVTMLTVALLALVYVLQYKGYF